MGEVVKPSSREIEKSNITYVLKKHKFVRINKNGKWVHVENSELISTKAKLKKVNRLYEVLSKINHAIIRIKHKKSLYNEACRIAVENGDFDVAWIGIINKETLRLEAEAQWGMSDNEKNALAKEFEKYGIKKHGMITHVIETGEYIMTNDIREKTKRVPWHENIINHNVHSCAIFPLKIEDEVIGIMAFYSKEYFFAEEEEIRLLKSLCEDISFAMKNIEKETNEKQIEEELKQSEKRYRNIFELSPTAIIVHSDFEILYANLAASKLLGAERPEEIIGRNLLDFVYKSYHEIVINRWKMLKPYGEPLPFAEEKYIKLDGTVIDVEATGTLSPYKDKDAMVSVIRDITEEKKVEQLRRVSEENERLLDEAREYDKLRTEFFANISHELRTPINVILSAIQLLNLYVNKGYTNESDSNVSKYMYTMQQNSYRLLKLVSNIIDITKIDSGFFELQLENCNIVSVVEDITLSVSEYIENKGIKLIFDTDVEEKLMTCDRDKIERVMLNLLSNSVKFTKPGGKISVNIYDKNDKILISVKDNGIGIPENKKDQVFERFQQVDKSLTRNNEGSGIGLSIVKSLIELHQGTIKLESEYGKGTEFIIELPVKVNSSLDIDAYNGAYSQNIEKINIEFSDIDS